MNPHPAAAPILPQPVPSRPGALASRRFRCAVKVALPRGQRPGQAPGLDLDVLHAQLRRLFGRDGYSVVPTAWDGSHESVAVLFDDAAKAFYVAAWADARWPLSASVEEMTPATVDTVGA